MPPPPLPDTMLARLASIASEKFVTAQGPGGQNVNKVATAVQLRIPLFSLGLAPDVYHRLRDLAGSRVNNDGELLIIARAHRTQEANRADAMARAIALIEQAHDAPAKRAKSRLNRIGKEARLVGKKTRSAVKKGRGKVALD